MQRPECAVKGCENKAFTCYGDKWVCGGCMVKLIEKEKQRKNEMLEDL